LHLIAQQWSKNEFGAFRQRRLISVMPGLPASNKAISAACFMLLAMRAVSPGALSGSRRATLAPPGRAGNVGCGRGLESPKTPLMSMPPQPASMTRLAIAMTRTGRRNRSPASVHMKNAAIVNLSPEPRSGPICKDIDRIWHSIHLVS
jgi:hypothetical protein